MREHAARIANAVSALCALVAMGAVLFWAPVCPGSLELANGNMTPMRCAYTGKVALLLGVALLIVSVAALLTKKNATVAVCVLSAALILITFETAMSIGVCRSAMACWNTAFWLRACGGVSLAAAIVGALLGTKVRRVVE